MLLTEEVRPRVATALQGLAGESATTTSVTGAVKSLHKWTSVIGANAEGCGVYYCRLRVLWPLNNCPQRKMVPIGRRLRG